VQAVKKYQLHESDTGSPEAQVGAADLSHFGVLLGRIIPMPKERDGTHWQKQQRLITVAFT